MLPWIFLWFGLGLLAYISFALTAYLIDGRLTVGDLMRYTFFLPFGPISLVVMVIVLVSVVFEKYKDTVLFKRKKK
jgi:hypothetical protein